MKTPSPLCVLVWLALVFVLPARLAGADTAVVWRAPTTEGVSVVAEPNGKAQVVSTIKADYVIDSVATLPARGGDCFAITVRAKAGVDMAVRPLLVCLDAQGRELSPPAVFGRGERASTTNWQTIRHVFVALPNTASVRARLLTHGRGTLLLEDFALGATEVDPYVTGALIPPGSPRGRSGVILESNFAIVNAERITTADRDGDGKWAVIVQDLDALTAPEKKGEDWRSNWEDNPNVILWSDGAVLKSDTIAVERAPDVRQALHFRARVRPGPYTAKANDPGRPVAFSLDGKTWKRADPGNEIDLGVVGEEGEIELWLDACYRDSVKAGPAYFDYVRLLPTLHAPSVERLFAAARAKPEQARRGSVNEKKVPIATTAPSGWPVGCGLPIPRGELLSAGHVTVLDPRGAAIPSQARAMATWPDGTVKWLFVDFLAARRDAADGPHALVYGHEVRPVEASRAVKIEKVEGGLTVDTGALRFFVSGERFGLVGNVRIGSGELVQQAPITSEIVEAAGRVWSSLEQPVTRIEIEHAGPLHAVIVVETKLAESGKPAKGFFHRARIHAYAGSPLVTVDYFVANTDSRPAKDVGGSMASKIPIRSFALQLRPVAAITAVHHEGGVAPSLGSRVQKTDRVVADIRGNESPGHVRGWLGLTLARGGHLHVGVADFREQFPKALRWNRSQVNLDLWAEEGGTFDWIEGVGKTHHVALYYGSAPASPELLADGPVLATAAPEWYVRSGAFGDIGTAAESGHAAIERNLAGHMKNPIVERVGLGFENYGDHNSSGYVKGFPLWDNNEYDTPAACLVHFARTGERAALRLGLAGAQHYMDVDTIHYSSQHAAWGRAQHVHSHGTFGHHTAQGPDYHHAGYVQGLIWHGYLTGDPTSVERARGIADWAIRNTPVLTTGMERLVGHALMTCNDTYEATGDERYLRAAAGLVDQALKWEHPLRSGFLSAIHERPAYYSGSPFSNGVISAGLIKFNDWAQAPEVDALLERFARWTLTDMWKAPAGLLSKGGPSRSGGDAQHIGNQGRLMARVFARTKDPLFLAVPWKLADLGYGEKAKPIFGTRSTGLVYNYLPWLIEAWRENGRPEPDPQLEFVEVLTSVKLPPGASRNVTFVVKNTGSEPVEDFRVSFHSRLDFAITATQPAPPRVMPGESVSCSFEIRAPAQVNLSSDYNSVAWAHWSALHRRGGRTHFAHHAAKLMIDSKMAVASSP